MLREAYACFGFEDILPRIESNQGADDQDNGGHKMKDSFVATISNYRGEDKY